MTWMGRLEAMHMKAKLAFLKPVGKLAAQEPLALGGLEMGCAMQGVAAKGRVALAGDDKNQPVALLTAFLDEMEKPEAGQFEAHAMQVNAIVRFHLAAGKLLGEAAVKAGKRWRRVMLMGGHELEMKVWRMTA
ncbi:MAG: hypothetical protein U1E15_01090 [Hyphomicrobiales bacterium]